MAVTQEKPPRRRRSPYPLTSWLAPSLLFLILVAATVFVWRQQVSHQRSLLVEHTRDVAFQASRRLEIFIESRLVVAEIFSERWATHEGRDFSKRRFAKFAAVLLGKIAGFHTVWLVHPDRRDGWEAPLGSRSVLDTKSLRRWPVFAEAKRQRKTVLSAPIDAGKGATSFLAVRPLHRQREFLGYLVVEFDTQALFTFCFHEHIRSEFSFRIDDGTRLLYRYAPRGAKSSLADVPITISRRFQVRNRTWRMSVSPRTHTSVSYTSGKNLLTLLFGLVLSCLVTALFALFTRQTQEKRRARELADRALLGKAAAQSALLGSEERYRNVFDSASDGLLILDDNGNIVDANRAASRMYDRDTEHLISKPIEALVPSQEQERFQSFLRRAHRDSTARIEVSGENATGGSMDVEIKGNLFDYGESSRVLLIIREVTERKRAERRLAQLSRKVLLAQEDERARVARDLHDELGQIITALRLELDLSRKQLPLAPRVAAEAFNGPIALLEKATAELRRICEGLRPPLLDDLGIGPAVEQLLENFAERTGIEITTHFQIHDETTVSSEIALSAYRVLQEATTNVARHAEASTLAVSLVTDQGRLALTIEDNGVGFDQNAEWASRGSGISGMEERAHLAGGQLQMHVVPGSGTRVTFTAPLAASASGGGK